MPTEMGGVKGTQNKVGDITTTIENADGEWIAWDLVREACDVPVTRRNDPAFLTIPEAARKWKIASQAIYSRARRQNWRVMTHHNKRRAIIKEGKVDWGKRADQHREAAFKIGHESLKKFKARSPKNFRELDIADRMARRAAGLENDSVIQQTLVHVNEAVEDHADAQVIEANVVELLPDQTAPLTSES